MFKVPEFQTAYMPSFRGDDLDFPKGSVGAKQSFREECDINNIIKRHSPSGDFREMLLVPGRGPGMFGDFTGLPDFRGFLDYVSEAQRSFLLLPAEIRRQFENDPQAFVAFCMDPANAEGLQEFGLKVDNGVVVALKPPVEGPPSVPPVKAPVAPMVAPEAPPKS